MTMQRYRGACDASAATRIAGTACFVTASDEDYVLRVYDTAQPGLPIEEIDVTSFLDPVDRTKEPDIEGSAQIGNRVYWIGSHGCNKDAEQQESRQRLFATEVSIVSGRPELRPIGAPYKQLLQDLSAAQDLAEFDLAAAASLAPEASGGLNIEGLTSTPDGQLLLGFRNPIPRGRALVLRLENPAEIVGGASRARVVRGRLLDLGGRGVRAIEPRGDGQYYILAGAFDDRRDFALFIWDGLGAAPALLLDGASLNELNPEELVASVGTDGDRAVQLFSDDGDMMVGQKKCKKVAAADRSFRVATFQLPA